MCFTRLHHGHLGADIIVFKARRAVSFTVYVGRCDIVILVHVWCVYTWLVNSLNSL